MSDTTPAVTLTDALVTELAAALGAMAGAGGAATPASGDIEPGWRVSVSIGAPSPGVVSFGLSHHECVALVRRITGDEAPADEAIADLLREILGQAVGALREKPAGRSVLFCVESPVRHDAPPEGSLRVFTIELGDQHVRLATWAQFEAPAARNAALGPSGPRPVIASGGGRGRDDGASAAGIPANLDVILDIDLPLSVRFGQTDLTLDALTRLGPGSVIDLGRSPDDRVDVLVNGRLIARAEVVVVGGNYGVRITEVVSAADRVRSLTA